MAGYRQFARCLLLYVLLAAASGKVFAQQSLTEYYSYPFSLGAGYVPFSSVGEVDLGAAVSALGARFRLPLPFLPSVQPVFIAGLSLYDSDVAADPSIYPGGVLDAGATMPDYNRQDVWDHRQIYGALGVGYAYRMSREFELGIDAVGGLSQSSFGQRIVSPDGSWKTVGELGLVAGLTGRIALNPSFNISIDILPTLWYARSLGNLAAFDGFYFGLGIGANYRFGRDPDAPGQSIRAIEFSRITMPPVFAAMQSVYVNEPVARIEITNTAEFPLTDVVVAFNQPGYMDSATESARLEELEPGESRLVPLYASYNGSVFQTNGVTPMNGEIAVDYIYRGQVARQTQNVTYDLHDRNAMTWDDDRKVAAFITQSDSAVGNYASFVRASARGEQNEYLPDNLEAAMQVYHALDALGLVYQPDPTAPFAQVQGDTLIVDSVSLPRETLRAITGDCDDITVLYNSLLESQGISTGFVTLPGHIYSAINTGVESREFDRVHPDRRMTVDIDGTLWIYVEITLIGETSFLDAWQTGMRQWRQYDDEVALRGFHRTAEAQAEFRPVGLVESDLGLQYGSPESFLQTYRTDKSILANLILAPFKLRAEEQAVARAWNTLGATAARLGEFDLASAAFSAASDADPDDLAAPLNEGSLHFLRDAYDDALESFRRVEAIAATRDSVPRSISLSLAINLAKTLYELGEFEEAAAYVSTAERLDPQESEKYRAIAAAGTAQGGRAAGVDTGPRILFVDEAID